MEGIQLSVFDRGEELTALWFTNSPMPGEDLDR
jgi:hypothetical protein